MQASEREELIALLVSHGCASVTAAVVIDAIEAAGFVIAKPASDEEIMDAYNKLHGDFLTVTNAKLRQEAEEHFWALIASRSRPVVTEEGEENQ